MKRLLAIGLAGAAAVSVLLLVLLLTMAAGIAASQSGSNVPSDSDGPIPCTLTGTRQGNQLQLTLSYAGIQVRGISGTVQSDGRFSAASRSKGGRTRMQLPTSPKAKLGVQTFMCYTAVTARSSAQYKLLNSSQAKDEGLYRKVAGRYAVALGSFYGSRIGTTYTLTFRQADGTQKTISAVLGDQKADRHTDARNQYHTVDGSVVEFITAKGTSANVSATQRQINADFGTLTGIYKSGGTQVSLTGTIQGTSVTVEGRADGQPLSASGTIQEGKIHAEGFLGEGAAQEESGSYTGGKFAWPLPGYTRLSSKYGWRTCPFHGREKHSGLDIPAPFGTSVLAAASGSVVTASYQGSYGNAVVVSHGSSLYTLYGHNSSLLVKVGDKVRKGQPLARVGSTGSSTGNHCHFEVRKGKNAYGNDVDPWTYLK